MREHRLLSGKPKAVQFMFKLASHRWFDNFIILVRGKDAFSDRQGCSFSHAACPTIHAWCPVPCFAPCFAPSCCPCLLPDCLCGCADGLQNVTYRIFGFTCARRGALCSCADGLHCSTYDMCSCAPLVALCDP